MSKMLGHASSIAVVAATMMWVMPVSASAGMSGGVLAPFVSALGEIQALSKCGSPEAQTLLGTTYDTGEDVPEDMYELWNCSAAQRHKFMLRSRTTLA